MNPYVLSVTCDVCGGPGKAMIRDVGALWTGGSLRHNNPETCAMYLEQKRMRLEKLAKQVGEAFASV